MFSLFNEILTIFNFLVPIFAKIISFSEIDFQKIKTVKLNHLT